MAASLSAHRATIGAVSGLLRQDIETQLQNFANAGEPPGPARQIDLAPPGPNDVRTLAKVFLPPLPGAGLAVREIEPASIPFLIAPDLPQVAEEAAPVRGAAPAQDVTVAARLKDNLTPDLLKNFSLFLYVSTAPKGPLAQRLYVFRKDANGALVLVNDWAASTGRARNEISPQGKHSFTATPGGYYEFDPARMYRSYYSNAWNGSMPYAMFFNWENHGAKTGVAVHSATGNDIAKLGNRASAGCIHLSPAHAQELYNLIRAQYRGAVPRFAYDAQSQTMSNRGELMRGTDGKPVMTDGYRVLTFIENFGGGKTIAALD